MPSENKTGKSSLFAAFGGSRSLLLALLALLVGVALLAGGTRAGSTVSPDTQEQARLQTLCSQVRGVGKCLAAVHIEDGRVVSVVLVCDGASSAAVCRELTDMVCTLYGIGSNRVRVCLR